MVVLCGGSVLLLVEDTNHSFVYTNNDTWWDNLTRDEFKITQNKTLGRLLITVGGKRKEISIKTTPELPTPTKVAKNVTSPNLNLITFKDPIATIVIATYENPIMTGIAALYDMN